MLKAVSDVKTLMITVWSALRSVFFQP